MAIKTDGSLWAWRSNTAGALGDGTTERRRYLPVRIASPSSNWVSVATGSSHTVATKSDGTLWTWGEGNYGELGDGTTEDRNVPVQVIY
jgi:alpha-tubulin suppressor-like RCC1 family protein